MFVFYISLVQTGEDHTIQLHLTFKYFKFSPAFSTVEIKTVFTVQSICLQWFPQCALLCFKHCVKNNTGWFIALYYL
jgi:hypothetical protein